MDNLQALWRNAQPMKDDSGISADELKRITQQKSRQEFDRFKRVIRWELVANIPIIVFFLYFSTTVKALNNLFILSLSAVVFTAYAIWQYRFYRKIQRHTLQNNVQTYLTEGLSLLKHYLRVYQGMIIASVVFGGFIGFWMVWNSGSEGPPLLFSEDVTFNLVYSILFAISLFLAAHLYMKYAYKDRISRMQRYQEKLEHIRQLVSELQKEN